MKILVIGDYCLDEFIYCKCERLSPEAPVPVALPISKETNDGMAGNVYRNLVSLNKDSNVKIDIIKSIDPIIKTRYIDRESKQTLLRVDSHDYVDLQLKVSDIKYKYDAIVIADYEKGFIDESFLIELPKFYPDADLYLDTKKIIKEWGGKYIIKINDTELDKTLLAHQISYKFLITTHGSKGSTFTNGDCAGVVDKTYIPSIKVEVNEVSGAGDTFMAALVVAHTVEKKNWIEAIGFANRAAAEAVKHVGVVTVEREWIK